jgi:hypothetical protein
VSDERDANNVTPSGGAVSPISTRLAPGDRVGAMAGMGGSVVPSGAGAEHVDGHIDPPHRRGSATVDSTSFTVNGRTYTMPGAPVVVICIDGSEPDYHDGSATSCSSASSLPTRI